MPRKKTILVVDDDPTVLSMLAAVLEASYRVLIAADGVAAAYLYERNVEKVAAVITDLEMPRLNGQSLAEWVHHIKPKLPVIIMSGGLWSKSVPDFLQRPMISFLGKPFEPAQLEALLSNALNGVQEPTADLSGVQ
jgi:DNA-binding NtrC family response regulator